jgi:hypothetical protein
MASVSPTSAKSNQPVMGSFSAVVVPLVLLVSVLIGAATWFGWFLIHYVFRAPDEQRLRLRRLDTGTTLAEKTTDLGLIGIALLIVLIGGSIYILVKLIKESGSRSGGDAFARALLRGLGYVVAPIALLILFAVCVLASVQYPLAWLGVVIPVWIIANVFNIWMYYRDSASIPAMWAVCLAFLRALLFAVLVFAFLLPSLQNWEVAEKRSRIVLLLDVSDSITRVTDEIPTPSRPPEKLETRLDKVLNFLTDEKIAFLDKLLQKNPVVVYRFASRLDEESNTFPDGKPAGWDREAWATWIKMDFKQWLLQGLSPEGQTTLRDHPEFQGDKPGNAEWAIQWLQKDKDETIPHGGPGVNFSEADQKKLEENRLKLDKRIEVCRQILQGTNVADSLLTAINREASNMVQGVVLISDGRSTQGSESAIIELRTRARRDNIPVFTVVVGEDRQPISIQIIDVQTPEQAPPNEKFVIRAEVDGVGLPGKEKPIFLDVYRPGDDPKKAKPIHTIPLTITFQPGEPPHGQVEFPIDPTATEGKDKLPLEMFKPTGAAAKKDEKEPAKKDEPESTSNKPELLEGEWKFIIRVPKDDGEAFVGKEHVSDAVSVQVIKKPLRVLLFASGPTHDYQFLRTLLVREKDAKRAELSIYLQNEGKSGGPGDTPRDVQDVEIERRLTRFPTTLNVGANQSTGKDKYYNLDQYDVIIAIDPDWSELTEAQLNLIKNWVEHQAGGLIIVGGPIHTFQLARAEDNSKFKALMELFPVIPGDSVLPVNPQFGRRRSTKKPWFLNFPGANKDMEFLKLDEDKNFPLAGWDEFFFRREHRTETDVEARRGFYSFYPVQNVKKGAVVVATFADPEARMPDGSDHPFLVTMEYPKGRIVFLGSGEMYRLRGYKEVYYERFWIKLARYASAGTRVRQNKRGVLVMGRQFTAGGFVRLEAQLFGPDSNPLPENVEVKAYISPLNNDDPKARKEIKLAPKRSSVSWGGWFQGRYLVETAGEYKVEVPIPAADESLRGKFLVKESNPELDMVRPDFAALYQMAGEIDEVLPRMDKGKAEELRKLLAGRRIRTEKPAEQKNDRADEQPIATEHTSDAPRLFFDLKSAETIPDCMLTETRIQRNKGKTDDLWDKGFYLRNIRGYVIHDRKGLPIEISWMLLAMVGLFSMEWLSRKLLRLA